jgi:hypothetical protein
MANTEPSARFWKFGIIMESVHKSGRFDGTCNPVKMQRIFTGLMEDGSVEEKETIIHRLLRCPDRSFFLQRIPIPF